MKTRFYLFLAFWSLAFSAFAMELPREVMSEKYWAFWNDDVQKKIDADIEKNRKADAVLTLSNVRKNSKIDVQQISHDFQFGSNIFLFGQLGSEEKNKAYEAAFGELFNAATVAFYWKTLEPEPGKIRFAADSEYSYRRPPTDPVVAFCESRGLNIHGHAIIYGIRRWGHPEWMPNDRKAMEPLFEKHVQQLAERYGDRVHQWDVVNECIDQANRGIMPDDYTYKTFRWAEKYFPAKVLFSTNECDMAWGPTRRYVEIARDLKDRGAKVDLMGVQSHIFDPQGCQSIADGAKARTPEQNYAVLDCMSEAELPIHISEVTISAPSDDEKGRLIQAIVARNLYRLWFSYPRVVRITWWNAVDGGAAPGEPSISGLFTKDLEKKPVYHALYELIQEEWKTHLTLDAESSEVAIPFRGFRGKYRVTWTDTDGQTQTKEIHVR
ncbi:MAG: endo-1,4-beta-xylanase [Planctomycetia bacterium]|nr:endo-1,4-beta-xylanase [Planctomycetia bacterium]